MLIGSWKGVAVGIGVAVGVRVGVGVLVVVSVGVGIVAVGVGSATGAGRQPASKTSKSTAKSVSLIPFYILPGHKLRFLYRREGAICDRGHYRKVPVFSGYAGILADWLNFVQAASSNNLPICFVSGISCTHSNHSSSARAA